MDEILLVQVANLVGECQKRNAVLVCEVKPKWVVANRLRNLLVEAG